MSSSLGLWDSVVFLEMPDPYCFPGVTTVLLEMAQGPPISSFNRVEYYYCPLGNVYETNIVFLEIPKT